MKNLINGIKSVVNKISNFINEKVNKNICTDLKTLVSPIYLDTITKTLSNLECENIEFGTKGIKKKKNNSSLVRHRINTQFKSICKMNITNEFNEDTFERLVSVKSVIYTVDKDNYTIEYEFETYCKGIVPAEDYCIDSMIDVAISYCEGLIFTNNLNKDLKYSLVIPNVHELDPLYIQKYNTEVVMYDTNDLVYNEGDVQEDNSEVISESKDEKCIEFSSINKEDVLLQDVIDRARALGYNIK